MQRVWPSLNKSTSVRDIGKKLGSPLEARMLIQHITGLTDADIIASDTITLSREQYFLLENMIDQRLNGKPVSKIIGFKEFYGRDFIVTEDVLDPRPDSETLIESVLPFCQSKEWSGRILDLGTGSGCLILTLLSELPHATGIATDISGPALDVAKQNAKNLGLSERVNFILSDWFDAISESFDIIISNPPYIERDIIPKLQKEVRNYDPLQALDGGEDGLKPYQVILPQIRNHLNKKGFLALEHGSGQCGRIAEIAERAGLTSNQTKYDLAGHDRVFTFINI